MVYHTFNLSCSSVVSIIYLSLHITGLWHQMIAHGTTDDDDLGDQMIRISKSVLQEARWTIRSPKILKI
ncbi:hypothetical protein O6P43_032523 [Quillaja saponaria]|uniref:Uncharacterized protein n=1 Tax=Quillaja saponaria TaxID=32244 RepID=A0AAD7P5M4_QUISA|nr:hypothetical protein O6P43_032523 [Quillaja saponaria]